MHKIARNVCWKVKTPWVDNNVFQGVSDQVQVLCSRPVSSPSPPSPSRNQLRLRSEKWKILDLSCHKFWVNLHNLPSRQLRPGADNNLLIRRDLMLSDCRIICWHSSCDNISQTWLRLRVLVSKPFPSSESEPILNQILNPNLPKNFHGNGNKRNLNGKICLKYRSKWLVHINWMACY